VNPHISVALPELNNSFFAALLLFQMAEKINGRVLNKAFNNIKK